MPQKQYFVRVPEDMYHRIRQLAEWESRSINLMSNILLGQAINSYKGVSKPVVVLASPETKETGDWSGDQGLEQPEEKPALRVVVCKVHGIDREACKLMKH